MLLTRKRVSNKLLDLYIKYYRKFRTNSVRSSVTLSMITHNEAGRYLKDVLEQIRPCIDNAVIVDDCSSDNTVDIIESILADKNLYIYKQEKNLFNENESTLRRYLWKKTTSIQPDWILALDADELLEENYEEEFTKMVNESVNDYYRFRLYDMWNDTNHYRDDEHWHAHKTYRPFLYRYYPFFPYRWNKNKLHCGRVPDNLRLFPGGNSEIRIKHLGWMRQEDRKYKFERYLKLDGEGSFGNKQQYLSILNDNPNLVEWKNR